MSHTKRLGLPQKTGHIAFARERPTTPAHLADALSIKETKWQNNE